MTITQLTYIVAVDNFKSFAQAASECFVTQPTLSMQIKKLEDELGIKIFDRASYPVKTTKIGAKIIEQARTVLKEHQKIKEIVDEELGIIKGRFRLGIIPTIAPFLLPLFLENFIKKHSQLNLVFDEIETDIIIDKLKKDQLDAAILATPLNDNTIVEEPIYYEPFVAYVSKKHFLFNRKKINAAELQLKDLWLLKEGHCFRDQVINICKKYCSINPQEEKPSPTFEGGTIETLKKLVENNFGMTLLPYLAVKEIENTENYKFVREFEKPVPKREISIVYHKSYGGKRIIKALKKEILSVVPAQLLVKEKSIIVTRD
ncbi:LysR substrate-binding domain-containing protein [Melioribacteraceae bacterium 4301-Me]|uniref:hydrogen peroxide-inducible genes activator n=1 Tax=Pyranulibacter aquaticus TaxID=3163344 RepID=UPI003597B0C3